MNFQYSEPIVTEKKSYLTILLTLLGGVIVVTALYQGYVFYQNQELRQSALLNQGEISPLGLNAAIDSTRVPTGNIYFSAVFASTSLTEPLAYTYNVGLNSIEVVTDTTFTGVGEFGTSSYAGIMSIDQYGATNSFQPYVVDRVTKSAVLLPNKTEHSVKDLTISPDGTRYAYSYQTADGVVATQPQVLSYWHIAIHEFNSDEVITIDSANEPEWINNGAQLLYMKEEGLAVFDLATRSSQTVFATYAPYTNFDDIAVSPNSLNVIVTKSNQNLISVLAFDRTKGLSEQGRFTSKDTTYYSPVFSPDSLYFAANAKKVSDVVFNASEMIYEYTSSHTLEIRQIDNSTVVQSVPLDNVTEDSVTISSWHLE